MTDRPKIPPRSLDVLLSDTRQSFDDMFADQMAGGATARRVQEKPASDAPPALAPAAVEPRAPAEHRPLAATDPERAVPLAFGPVDLVAVNRFAAALATVRDEVGVVFARSVLPGYGPSAGTASAMIMDGAGQLLSGTDGAFLAYLLHSKSLNIAAGDVLLLGDPFGSGGATARPGVIMVICPIDTDQGRIGYVSLQGHLGDVGGNAPGSAPVDAKSTFAEGLCIPPIKIHNGGMLNQCALDLILSNGRAPQTTQAVLMGLIDACRHGVTRTRALLGRMGEEHFHRVSAALIANAETAMGALIRRMIPEEPQSFEDCIDDDGLGNGPFTLRLTVWREGSHAYFDWTGTAAQALGPINLPLHVGRAKAMIVQSLAGTMGTEALASEGADDLIHVTLPTGSLLNPDFPAPVGWQMHTVSRVVDMLNAAINRHEPMRLSAAGGGTASFRYTGHGFSMVELMPGGGSASPHADGEDAHETFVSNGVPTEEVEADYPVLIEAFRSLPDSGGAGLCRGGNGVERVYRFLEPGHVSLHDDRHASHPWGVNGGHAGGCSAKWIERDDGMRETLPAKLDAFPVQPGDKLVFQTAGGGGAGDPLTRAPHIVLGDVVAGVLTVDRARSHYGVIIDNGQIDHRATDALRTGLTRERPRLALFDRGQGA